MHSASSFSSSTRRWPAGRGNGEIGVALAGIAAEAEGLQVAEVVGTALVLRHDVVHLQGPLMLVRAAALATAPGAGEHPIFDRADDRGAVAAAVGKHLFAALLAEGIEALAAEIQQLIALGVAQLVAAHQGVGAPLAAGDAVAREHLAHHALPRIRRATSCAGAGLRRLSSSISISGWTTWLMRMRSAMVCRRR